MDLYKFENPNNENELSNEYGIVDRSNFRPLVDVVPNEYSFFSLSTILHSSCYIVFLIH